MTELLRLFLLALALWSVLFGILRSIDRRERKRLDERMALSRQEHEERRTRIADLKADLHADITRWQERPPGWASLAPSNRYESPEYWERIFNSLKHGRIPPDMPRHEREKS